MVFLLLSFAFLANSSYHTGTSGKFLDLLFLGERTGFILPDQMLNLASLLPIYENFKAWECKLVNTLWYCIHNVQIRLKSGNLLGSNGLQVYRLEHENWKIRDPDLWKSWTPAGLGKPGKFQTGTIPGPESGQSQTSKWIFPVK